ncbi:MAG: cytochrome c peroxidase [Bacteroidota bacterium]
MQKAELYFRSKYLSTCAIILSIIVLFNCCDDDEIFNPVMDIENFISPLPRVAPVPENNPLTSEKAELGRLLFWDPVLSGNKDVACATCHHPGQGYADGLDISIGIGGSGLGESRKGTVLAKRNAHTVLNSAFNGIDKDGITYPLNSPMFWDNRAMSLEEQALLPILSKEEMLGNAIHESVIYDTIVGRLSAIPEYRQVFKRVFGTDAINIDRIANAIASFERTLITSNSPFDRYLRGDRSAMTPQQIDGMNAFVNVGCAACHSGPMFSDFKLHTLGIPDNPKLPDTDDGNGNYAFRTPSLRNLSLTAPYMHNGMHTSLMEVMNFYEEISEGDDHVTNDHVNRNEIAPLARRLDMEDDATNEIIAFINALNDPDFDRAIPVKVPSGLQVGGKISN